MTERGRETDRQTDRDRKRERERQRQRDRETETERVALLDEYLSLKNPNETCTWKYFAHCLRFTGHLASSVRFSLGCRSEGGMARFIRQLTVDMQTTLLGPLLNRSCN